MDPLAGLAVGVDQHVAALGYDAVHAVALDLQGERARVPGAHGGGNLNAVRYLLLVGERAGVHAA